MATDPADHHAGRGSTYRFLLSPKWIAFHLLVLALVVTMINLAFWQLRRLDERQQFNARVRANANQPIQRIEDVLVAEAEPAGIEWRRVRVTGSYLPDHQLLVINRSQNGVTGRNVVDPLQLADGSLLVMNRGFVAASDAIPRPPGGEVELIGRLRVSERRKTGQLTDSSDAALTEIRRIDVPLLRGRFDQPLQPMYVELLESSPADSAVLQPIVAPTLDEGPHLSYTIQWLIFSTAVVAGWIFAVRRSMAMRTAAPGAKRSSSYIPISDDQPTTLGATDVSND